MLDEQVVREIGKLLFVTQQEEGTKLWQLCQFNDPNGADHALSTLGRLQQQDLIEVLDAAVVSWPQNRKGPKTRQAIDLVGAAAFGGAFWGFLFGLIFFVPLLGLALGAATGAVGGAFADVGIDDRFVEQTRNKVTPGTSALFLLSQRAVADRVVAELRVLNPELITTNLPAEQEARLRELFGEDQAPARSDVEG